MRHVVTTGALLLAAAVPLATEGCGAQQIHRIRRGHLGSASGGGAGDAAAASGVLPKLPSEEIAVGGENGPLSAANLAVFEASVHPVVRAHCAACHTPDGKPSVAPFFAHPTPAEAAKVAVSAQKVDFTTLSASRLVRRLTQDKHNCWSGDCNADGAEMLAAVEKWAAGVKLDDVAALGGAFRTQSQPVTRLVDRMPLEGGAAKVSPSTYAAEGEGLILTAPFTVQANAMAMGGSLVQTPAGDNKNGNATDAGRAVFNVDLGEAGEYRLLARVLAPNNNSNSFFVRVDDGDPIAWNLQANAAPQWRELQQKLQLTAGKHAVAVQQAKGGTGLDQIVLTLDDTFMQLDRPVPGVEQPPPGKALRYDIGQLVEQPDGVVFFEIAVESLPTEGLYRFSAPTIVVKSGSVYFKGVHVLINGVENPQATNYVAIGMTIPAPGAVLSRAAMTVIPATAPVDGDTIEVGFDYIEATE